MAAQPGTHDQPAAIGDLGAGRRSTEDASAELAIHGQRVALGIDERTGPEAEPAELQGSLRAREPALARRVVQPCGPELDRPRRRRARCPRSIEPGRDRDVRDPGRQQ
ncbi:MAG: hypothetical protein WKG01_39450 [Kofleriaceae bacterium]